MIPLTFTIIPVTWPREVMIKFIQIYWKKHIQGGAPKHSVGLTFSMFSFTQWILQFYHIPKTRVMFTNLAIKKNHWIESHWNLMKTPLNHGFNQLSCEFPSGGTSLRHLQMQQATPRRAPRSEICCVGFTDFMGLMSENQEFFAGNFFVGFLKNRQAFLVMEILGYKPIIGIQTIGSFGFSPTSRCSVWCFPHRSGCGEIQHMMYAVHMSTSQYVID